MAELRKIEARKKEREKKTQDLQKLISAADSSISDARKQKVAKKKMQPSKLPKLDTSVSNFNYYIKRIESLLKLYILHTVCVKSLHTPLKIKILT